MTPRLTLLPPLTDPSTHSNQENAGPVFTLLADGTLIATLAFDDNSLEIIRDHRVDPGTGRAHEIEKVITHLIGSANHIQHSILVKKEKGIYREEFDPINGGDIYVATGTLYEPTIPSKTLARGEPVPTLNALMGEFNLRSQNIKSFNFQGQFFRAAHQGTQTTLYTQYAFSEIASYLKKLGPSSIRINEYKHIVDILYQLGGARLKSPYAALRKG